jgi:hypothetical protein
MNQIKQIKSLKLDAWFLDQLEKPDSIPADFLWNFLLVFILKNLNKFQKEQFLRIVAGQKTDQVMPFVLSCIPNFEKKFSQALGKKLAQIKKSAISYKL